MSRRCSVLGLGSGSGSSTYIDCFYCLLSIARRLWRIYVVCRSISGEGALDPNDLNRESALSQLAKTEISLTLTSKLELLEGDDKDVKSLMTKYVCCERTPRQNVLTISKHRVPFSRFVFIFETITLTHSTQQSSMHSLHCAQPFLKLCVSGVAFTQSCVFVVFPALLSFPVKEGRGLVVSVISPMNMYPSGYTESRASSSLASRFMRNDGSILP